MRRGDFYNTKPVFYRRRNGVTTLWGNGVISTTAGLNLFYFSVGALLLSFIFKDGSFSFVIEGVTSLWTREMVREKLVPWLLTLFVALPLYISILRYFIRCWFLLIKALFLRFGRRFIAFNSRRLWVRGVTGRWGKPWAQVWLRFNCRKTYTLSHRGLCRGLKTKIFLDGGRQVFLREWDVWLAVGGDFETMMVYDLWRYAQRTGDVRCLPRTLIDLDKSPSIPYPEGYD